MAAVVDINSNFFFKSKKNEGSCLVIKTNFEIIQQKFNELDGAAEPLPPPPRTMLFECWDGWPA